MNMRILPGRKGFANRRLVLVVIALLLACLALLPGTVRADKPTLAEIEAAIKAQGLSWTVKEYDRTFATGALFDEKPEPAK